MNKKLVMILLAMTFIMSAAAIADANVISISVPPVIIPSVPPVIIPAIPSVIIPSVPPVIIPDMPSVITAIPPEIIPPTENTPEDDQGCAQVITVARNPDTGEQREFGSPCDIPPGWIIVENPEQTGEDEP